ncbi:pancreatic polypeptide prohormone-like [Hyperolius riggenbachi]|uniref:pancreatic polypeptide prohormone-like n=1 Tax=Hyperolius riggenbachi TaxID=752182 RepID=UPI0035A29B3D
MMKHWEGTETAIKIYAGFQGSSFHAPSNKLAKMNSILQYLSAFLFIVLALTAATSAAPNEPQHPGDHATAEQLAQYYSDLWQYITFVTRPRFGKRWDEAGVEDVPSY